MAPQVTAAAKAEILRLCHCRATAAMESATSVVSKSPLQVCLEIIPGSCAAYQYQLSFEAEAKAGDQSVCADGLELLVREHAWPHVQQLVLDYSEDLMGGSFRFDNPVLTTACNCGQSFELPATSLG